LTPNSLQHRAGTAQNKRTKNPTLCNWGLYYAAISTALKKWWQKITLYNNPLASDKLSAFLYFIS
jgi:hypothetical protein